MPTRSERRRRERAGKKPAGSSAAPALMRPRELIIAAAFGGALLAAFVAFLLLSGGDGDNPTTSASPFSPSTPDDMAIESLARQSIESLPRGQWPSLYESFTPEFQQRCPREEFVAAGEAAAREQGEQLPLLRFVGLENVVFEGEKATAIIVGEVAGQSQYRIRAAFQKMAGSWKLAPAAAVEGCAAAFDRISAS